jgi:xanthine dehydrogenase accessory factor
MRQTDKRDAMDRQLASDADLPHVYIMGAGHVGRALAALFQYLPVKCVLVDTRANELAQCDCDVETRQSAIPEADIIGAPAGSAFIVLTHDHALDFLLTSTALERGDAAYVGMIGSSTKRKKFTSWMQSHCADQSIEQLNCPIGANGSRDKRPSVIAAFVAAEVIADLTSETAVEARTRAKRVPEPGDQTDLVDFPAKKRRD